MPLRHKQESAMREMKRSPGNHTMGRSPTVPQVGPSRQIMDTIPQKSSPIDITANFIRHDRLNCSHPKEKSRPSSPQSGIRISHAAYRTEGHPQPGEAFESMSRTVSSPEDDLQDRERPRPRSPLREMAIPSLLTIEMRRMSDENEPIVPNTDSRRSSWSSERNPITTPEIPFDDILPPNFQAPELDVFMQRAYEYQSLRTRRFQVMKIVMAKLSNPLELDDKQIKRLNHIWKLETNADSKLSAAFADLQALMPSNRQDGNKQSTQTAFNPGFQSQMLPQRLSDDRRSSVSSRSSVATHPLALDLYTTVGKSKLILDELYNLESHFKHTKMIRQAEREEGYIPSTPDAIVYGNYFIQKKSIIQKFADTKAAAIHLQSLCDMHHIKVEDFTMPDLEPVEHVEPADFVKFVEPILSRDGAALLNANTINFKAPGLDETKAISLGLEKLPEEPGGININAWRLELPRVDIESPETSSVVPKDYPQTDPKDKTDLRQRLVALNVVKKRRNRCWPFNSTDYDEIKRFFPDDKLIRYLSEPLPDRFVSKHAEQRTGQMKRSRSFHRYKAKIYESVTRLSETNWLQKTLRKAD